MQPDIEMTTGERRAATEMIAAEVGALIACAGALTKYLPHRDRVALSKRLIELAARLDEQRH